MSWSIDVVSGGFYFQWDVTDDERIKDFVLTAKRRENGQWRVCQIIRPNEARSGTLRCIIPNSVYSTEIKIRLLDGKFMKIQMGKMKSWPICKFPYFIVYCLMMFMQIRLLRETFVLNCSVKTGYNFRGFQLSISMENLVTIFFPTPLTRATFLKP